MLFGPKISQKFLKINFPFRGFILFSNYRIVGLVLLLHKGYENTMFTTAANISPLCHVIIAKYCV